MGAVDWNDALANDPPTEPTSTIISRKYKLNYDGSVSQRKYRCAHREDLMRQHVHYDPSAVATHMDDRSVILGRYTV